MRTAIRMGVVSWGSNGQGYARALEELREAEVRWLCDPWLENHADSRRDGPRPYGTTDPEDLLQDEELDAIVVAVPLSDRHRIVSAALDAGKHVLVDTPLALTVDDADDLIQRAALGGRALVSSNQRSSSQAVAKLREMLADDELGELYYLHGERHVLERRGARLLWGAGAEEIDLVLRILGDQPIDAAARGDSYLEGESPDVVDCYLRFATGITVHLHLSRLASSESSRLNAVGSRRCVLLDAHQRERPLKIYEKAVASEQADSVVDDLRRSPGDAIIPWIPFSNPHRLLCERFVSAIRTVGRPTHGFREGAATVRVLEVLQTSLDSGRGEVRPVEATLGRTSALVRRDEQDGLLRPLKSVQGCSP
jgi:predicted dehydrogenase